MKYCLFLPLIFIIAIGAYGQNYSVSNVFTTDNGLPSNHVYEIAEDNNGFLWIGTDNGISRFDGKRFVNYSTKNGLPSNDVLQIIKDIDGTIWVNCYKQPPSYFDEKSNRFISFENNIEVVKNSSSLLYPNKDPNGGIYFLSATKIMFFKNRKFVEILANRNFMFLKNQRFAVITNNDNLNNLMSFKFYTKNDQYLGSIKIDDANNLQRFTSQHNVLVILKSREIICAKIESAVPFKVAIKKFFFTENIKWFTTSNTELHVILISGKILIYDLNTYKLKNRILSNSEINYSLTGRNHAVWIGTINDGMFKYTISKVRNIVPSKKISNNFLSISTGDDNTFFAGNYNGEILAQNKNSIVHQNPNPKNTVWIRAIATFPKKVICVSDLGYSINYKKYIAIKNNNKQTVSLKTALKLNDSILILGGNSGLFKLNILTNRYNYINSPEERVLSIAKISDQSFYFTANSGVYKYDLSVAGYSLVFLNSNLQHDNIQSIAIGKNNNLWFNTFKGNLYLLNKGNIAFSIKNSERLPINITKLLEVDNQLWISSKDGLAMVDISQLPKFTIKKISKSDGLNSDVVNDIAYKNDSIYAATSNGISVIANQAKNEIFNILPVIISTKINNQNVPNQREYLLQKDQTNVILELAGVDLTGHFNKFQYAINNKNWYNIEGNVLNLLLKSGANNLSIRALDKNNNITKKTLQLKFDVAIPFYKNIGFQVLASFLFFGILLFFYNRRKFEKQKIFFSQQLELEQQRNRITADLHDEIGSTLSSLQINSTVAHKLMEKDVDAAQKVLQKVESQAESLAEKIGDIIWSMKPGKDEFMTLSTRIKNYCNEVLGSTDIHYTIKIAKEIDTKITDFATRKNILLITKEGINNAIKYSKATKIKVSIRFENNEITIIISDNGIGFSLNETVGNGIGNMKNRAKELSATFELISTINIGTSIKLHFTLTP